MGFVGEVDEHEEHGWKAEGIEDTNATHTHTTGCSSLARYTNPIELQGKDPQGVESLTKDWQAIGRVPKRKRVQIDRIARSKRSTNTRIPRMEETNSLEES